MVFDRTSECPVVKIQLGKLLAVRKAKVRDGEVSLFGRLRSSDDSPAEEENPAKNCLPIHTAVIRRGAILQNVIGGF